MVPAHFVDDSNKMVFWDCPGFEDNRGEVQEIANAFYIQKIG